MDSLRLQAVLVSVSAGLLLPPRNPAPQPEPILGRWRGTSTCIVADWNSACKDEVVVFDFVSSPTDSTRILLHGGKVVAGTTESMGDLELVRDTATKAWNSDFANARVRIRWSYRVQGDSLTAELIDLPSRRVARHVVATRDRPPQ